MHGIGQRENKVYLAGFLHGLNDFSETVRLLLYQL